MAEDAETKPGDKQVFYRFDVARHDDNEMTALVAIMTVVDQLDLTPAQRARVFAYFHNRAEQENDGQ